MRDGSDMMALWALCTRDICRKAGCCRAVPFTCFAECCELVPEAVSDFVFCLYDGKEHKLGFDDALARVPEELLPIWSAWHEAITRITGRPSLHPGGRSRTNAHASAG